MSKYIPFSLSQIAQISESFPTPFHIYDEEKISANIKALHKAFSWASFKEYFAVKATPNPFLMTLLKKEGVGADCSSMAELELASTCGIVGEDIMFTSNNTPISEFKRAHELGAIINFDDLAHLSFFEENVAPLPELVCLRYNPGSLKAGNTIIGHPEEAKYGFTKEQLIEGYAHCKKQGVTRFGIHTMVASNELDPTYFVETAQILFDLVLEISQELSITFEFVNLGGGIGIPYEPGQNAVDLEAVGNGTQKAYTQTITQNKLSPLKIYCEFGRMVTGPYGYLVTKVLHRKETYKKFIGLDACMSDLMRPALYGAYHHISILGKESAETTETVDVTGSLCENNDKFAINRELPRAEAGDYLVIHDTGAHGHSMGFSYNGKPRSAELLLRKDGEVLCIRRAETLEDVFATLDFSALKDFS